MKNLPTKKIFLMLIGVVLIVASISYTVYSYLNLFNLKQILETKTFELQRNFAITQENLSRVKVENRQLFDTLDIEQGKNIAAEFQIEGLRGDIDELSETVEILEKLTNTDPELLNKYSKVYFLSENYIPQQLALIGGQYIYDKDKPQQIHTFVWPYLKNIIDAAERDGITLQIVSAYRSFGTQSSLKSSYSFIYGAGTANQFSADQGYSEHQLGTTVDFTTSEISNVFLGLERTEAYTWLLNRAYNYGFALSYPEKNSFYRFEPWHWRFVGRTLATKLHDEGKYFYELSQREIDEYLVNIFD